VITTTAEIQTCLPINGIKSKQIYSVSRALVVLIQLFLEELEHVKTTTEFSQPPLPIWKHVTDYARNLVKVMARNAKCLNSKRLVITVGYTPELFCVVLGLEEVLCIDQVL
jgi:hypothetical protein